MKFEFLRCIRENDVSNLMGEQGKNVKQCCICEENKKHIKTYTALQLFWNKNSGDEINDENI